MPQESIKTLIQCEKDAKEKIAQARKERDEMKKNAKADALEIVESLKVLHEKETNNLIMKNIEKLKEVEKEEERISNIKIQELNGILDNKEELVQEMARYIYKVNKSV